MEVTAQMVKDLRGRTGAGIMDCKEALRENNGDLEEAVRFLREKGLASAAKKAGREASDGLVDSFVAPDGRSGVLVEVNCETDFVAKTDDFRALVNMVIQHVRQ
ncbi:translation elongation factor Ts, partial [Nitrospinota bacterium]